MERKGKVTMPKLPFINHEHTKMSLLFIRIVAFLMKTRYKDVET